MINSLHIVEHEKDCQHMYTFVFHLNDEDFTFFILNNFRFFNQYLKDYKVQFGNIIETIKQSGNKLKLPISENILLSNFQTPSYVLRHKDFKKEYFLATQQTACVKLLFQGKLVKEIAFELELSIRTVQHYINNVRKKLKCPSIRYLLTHYELIKRTPIM